HQLFAQTLAERVLADEAFQLGNEFGVTPEAKVRLDPLLERTQAQLFQPRDLALGEGLVRKIGERWSAPEGQRLTEHRCRPDGVAFLKATPPRLDELLESLEVECCLSQRQAITRRMRLQQPLLGSEHLAERRDIVADDLARRGWW